MEDKINEFCRENAIYNRVDQQINCSYEASGRYKSIMQATSGYERYRLDCAIDELQEVLSEIKRSLGKENT